MRLTTAGIPVHIDSPVVGRVALNPAEPGADAIYAGPLGGFEPSAFREFKAVISTDREVDVKEFIECGIPLIHSVRHIDHLRDGYVAVLQPQTGSIRTLYRPDSPHNILFATERCNSNCLMCSQPPKDRDDTDELIAINLELIRLMQPEPEYLTITGGEPTLLRERLFTIISALRDQLPDTDVHMLTNGRAFAWPEYAESLASVAHPRFSLGIPLYSDSALVHDYVVQAKHAFDQTVLGLHQLARWGVPVEIRVVLHRLTIPRLPLLAEYLCRNFPFATNVALMGLEPTGYTPRNKDKLWIDPADYQDILEQAVETLAIRGMPVRIYNSQLCVLRPSLWKFARKSISDWKNIYLPECQSCSKLSECGGLFQSAERMHSAHIRSL